MDGIFDPGAVSTTFRSLGADTAERWKAEPTCRCGRPLEVHYRLFDGEQIITTWRCQARRWWNAWLHPHEYTLEGT